MKKYILLSALALAAISAATITLQRRRIESLSGERDAFRANVESLMRQTHHYKTQNGLNAARVRQLQLTIGEFEKFRAEDAALIARLRVERRDIERIIDTQTETIHRLRTPGRDSVRVNAATLAADTLLCLDYHTEWIDVEGCFDGARNFEGEVRCRDRLIYVEHVTPARFLGFMWRTRRIRRREQEILSLNPDTRIIGAEFVTIRK
jgi:hypothetical protein